jgi:hypothetical protein
MQPLTSPYMAYNGHEDSPYDECTGVDQYNNAKVEDFVQGNALIEGLQDYLSKQTSLTFDPAGGRAMRSAATYDPDGYDPDGYDSIFGLGRKRQQKKAEKKIEKAQIKLEHGDTKAAARKLKKGTAILNKIQAGQQATSSAQQQIQDVRDANQQLTTNQQLLNNPIQPLSSQPMSDVGSQGNTGGGGMGGALMEGTSTGTGVESAAPSTVPGSDEPTGWLAEEKTLGGVTVTSKKSKGNAVLIIVIAVLLVIGLVYFAKASKKK